MKLILVGGGTGGHINPAIAIANEMKALRPDMEILFIANPDGMENTLVPKAGYPVAHIRVTGFARGFSPHDIVHNLKTVSWPGRILRPGKSLRILSRTRSSAPAAIWAAPLSWRPRSWGFPPISTSRTLSPA